MADNPIVQWLDSKLAKKGPVIAKQKELTADEKPDHPVVAYWKHLMKGGSPNDSTYITDARQRELARSALHNRMTGRSSDPSTEEMHDWIGGKDDK